MAATGFWVLGVCQASSTEAVNAYVSQFPVISANLIINAKPNAFYPPNNFSVILSGSQIDNYMNSFYFGVSVQFPQCDPLLPAFKTASSVSSTGTFTTFNPIDAAAFWSFGMTMVVGVWLLAHNAGVIWRFISGRKL